MGTPASKISPSTDVSQGPRIGLRQNSGRKGPGGGSSGRVGTRGRHDREGRGVRPPAGVFSLVIVSLLTNMSLET
ncbi:hypothetical protein Psi02_55520 [Planotetraspora silvatica]|uniref:Uncharacterized protein n=1 Tax=Planotetraspora silvatica TaxID=234614 RepID=A0A8J3XU59_9ACTN|nr:hypothetical protein Psi02_55520 [Planotetraspora silvatica]